MELGLDGGRDVKPPTQKELGTFALTWMEKEDLDYSLFALYHLKATISASLCSMLHAPATER